MKRVIVSMLLIAALIGMCITLQNVGYSAGNDHAARVVIVHCST